MTVAQVRRHRKHPSPRRPQGVARRPHRSTWCDSVAWVATHAPLDEELAARERELDEWDRIVNEFWPTIGTQPVPEPQEDRSAEALRLINVLRDEAGLVRSIIAPALAERLILGSGGELTW